jgi:hypothetical protein
MFWNHRIVRLERGDLMFAEVSYDSETKKAIGYTEPFMLGDDLGDMRQLVNRLGDAINQDIINEADINKEKDNG